MYHISDQETQHGPYPLEKLRALREGGLISAEALYWDEEAAEWLSLEDKLQEAAAGNGAQPVAHAPALLTPASCLAAEPKPRMAVKAADFGRHFMAFCVDAVWIIALVVGASELARLIGMWAHEGTFSTVAFLLGFVFRDGLFGGRSLGRRITFSHIVKSDTLEPVGLGGAIKRNLAASLLLAAPCVIGGLLALLLGSFGGKAGAGIILAGWITVLKSAAGEGGQSMWDQMCQTLVVVRAKPGDQALAPATP